MGCDCITSCFVFKKKLVFHFSIDNLQNLTILLFTPTSATDFSTQLCRTLPVLSGNQFRLYLNSFSFSCSPDILPLIALIDPCSLVSDFLAVSWFWYQIRYSCCQPVRCLLCFLSYCIKVFFNMPASSWESFKSVILNLIISRRFPIVSFWQVQNNFHNLYGPPIHIPNFPFPFFLIHSALSLCVLLLPTGRNRKYNSGSSRPSN